MYSINTEQIFEKQLNEFWQNMEFKKWSFFSSHACTQNTFPVQNRNFTLMHAQAQAYQ